MKQIAEQQRDKVENHKKNQTNGKIYIKKKIDNL